MGNLTREVRYQGPSIVFKAKKSKTPECFCITKAALVDGEATFYCQGDVFSYKIWRVYPHLAKQERGRFAKWFYELFPEYVLKPETFSPPLDIELPPIASRYFIKKIFQDKYGIWTVLFSPGGLDGKIFVPTENVNSFQSWDLPIEGIKKLKAVQSWEAGWEI